MRGFLKGWLIFIILYLPNWYLQYQICLEKGVILCISSCPSHSNLLGTAVSRFPVLWRAPVMWKKMYKRHWIFPISYTLGGNRYSLWGRNVFLCWLLYTVLSATEKNTSSNPCSKESGHAGLTCHLILSLPFGPCGLLMLHGMENVLVWCERLLWRMCLYDGW